MNNKHQNVMDMVSGAVRSMLPFWKISLRSNNLLPTSHYVNRMHKEAEQKKQWEEIIWVFHIFTNVFHTLDNFF